MQPTQPIRQSPGQANPGTGTLTGRVAETQAGKASPFLDPAVPVRLQPVVRYRTKLKRGQFFPLTVVLKEEDKPLKRGPGLASWSGPMLTVHPIIAGAQVTPASALIPATAGGEAMFTVLPLKRGRLGAAHLEIRNNGTLVADLPLAMRVSPRRLTRFLTFLTVALPLLLLYLRTYPLEQFVTPLPPQGPVAGQPNPAANGQRGGMPAGRGGRPGGGGMPAGMRPGGGGGPPAGFPSGPPAGFPGGPPGGAGGRGGRPAGTAPNRGSGSQPLPQPPSGETPKKDGDAKPSDKDKSDKLLPISVESQQPKEEATSQEKKSSGPAEPAPRPAEKAAEVSHASNQLHLRGREALEHWIDKSASRIRYPHPASRFEQQGRGKDRAKAQNREGGDHELNLDDTPALLILAVAWLNYDAFSWANPDVLPDWVFSYGLNYIDWEANNALVSIYGGAILAVPFLEVECFFVLFILTVLVSFIQDPKRRTRTGTAFTV